MKRCMTRLRIDDIGMVGRRIISDGCVTESNVQPSRVLNKGTSRPPHPFPECPEPEKFRRLWAVHDSDTNTTEGLVARGRHSTTTTIHI